MATVEPESAPPVEPAPSAAVHDPLAVPNGLVVASEIAWRSIAIAAALGLAVYGAIYISFVVVPVIAAIFVTAMLEHVRRFLIRRRARPQVASMLSFLVGVLLITGVITSAVTNFYSNFAELTDSASEGAGRITDWLATGPLHLDAAGAQGAFDRVINELQNDPGSALSGAFSVLSTTGGLIAGGLLAFITTLFFVTDRQRIASGLTRIVPSARQSRVSKAMFASWDVLVVYVGVTLTEAFLCAVVVGVAAAIVGLPIAFTLAAVVFLLGFIPTIGAIVSGLIVVLTALVTKGVSQAVIIGIVVLVVQQLDANVLYPMLTSRRLSIHPLASLLLVTTGGVVGGLFGAFLAVPVAAMLMAARGSWIGDNELAHIAPP